MATLRRCIRNVLAHLHLPLTFVVVDQSFAVADIEGFPNNVGRVISLRNADLASLRIHAGIGYAFTGVGDNDDWHFCRRLVATIVVDFLVALSLISYASRPPLAAILEGRNALADIELREVGIHASSLAGVLCPDCDVFGGPAATVRLRIVIEFVCTDIELLFIRFFDS